MASVMLIEFIINKLKKLRRMQVAANNTNHTAEAEDTDAKICQTLTSSEHQDCFRECVTYGREEI